MNTQLATTDVFERPARRTWRARAVAACGPLTVAAGVLWAVVQPYRITLLHPRGEAFWWLAVQPPLLVVGAGLIFALVVAPPLLRDREEMEG